MEIPFFKPQLGPSAYREVAKVMDSGWLTTGRVTERFEAEFARYVGSRHAVMVTSCTAALHLGLLSAGIRPGDEVITTPYTFASTAEVIGYLGATPVFVDIREDTLNIDEKQIEARITSKTRAIIPVHFAGHPCEMDFILELARSHGLKVVEDAAHCTPAYYKGRPVGSLGDATCFSFYANKCITTGEGGMLTTDDETVAEQIKSLRLHGLSKGASDRFKENGHWSYDITQLGLKCNPTDIAAAIGVTQLESADDFFQMRREVAEQYRRGLEGNPSLMLPTENENVQSAWHLYVIRLRGQWIEKRNELILRLKENGIGTAVHYIPLHMHSYYRDRYGYTADDYPVALRVFQSVISLPLYPGMTAEQIKKVCQCLNEITG